MGLQEKLTSTRGDNMSDKDIISALVKGREAFRRLVQVYKAERTGSGQANTPGINTLHEADTVLASALTHLHALPEKPSEACSDAESKAYAGRLLREIGDLLETIMIMDRELRGSFSRKKPAPRFPGVSSSKVLHSYAMS